MKTDFYLCNFDNATFFAKSQYKILTNSFLVIKLNFTNSLYDSMNDIAKSLQKRKNTFIF